MISVLKSRIEEEQQRLSLVALNYVASVEAAETRSNEYCGVVRELHPWGFTSNLFIILGTPQPSLLYVGASAASSKVAPTACLLSSVFSFGSAAFLACQNRRSIALFSNQSAT